MARKKIRKRGKPNVVTTDDDNFSYALELALVLDPRFGDRLLPLARSMPVYVVSSPINAAAVEAAWHELFAKDGFLTAFGATSFEADQSDIVEVLAERLDFIEAVHGYAGRERSYTRLRIYGVAPSPAVEALLAEYGFLDFEPTDYGFVARR